MPGRPRTTLRRLEELVQRADALGNDLFELTPAQYRDRSSRRGLANAAWQAALEAAAQNLRQIRALRELVAEKVNRAEQLEENRRNSRPVME